MTTCFRTITNPPLTSRRTTWLIVDSRAYRRERGKAPVVVYCSGRKYYQLQHKFTCKWHIICVYIYIYYIIRLLNTPRVVKLYSVVICCPTGENRTFRPPLTHPLSLRFRSADFIESLLSRVPNGVGSSPCLRVNSLQNRIWRVYIYIYIYIHHRHRPNLRYARAHRKTPKALGQIVLFRLSLS